MKNTLWMKYPASWWGAKWREALPSGNGMLGAAVYGAVNEETILLTHADLWCKSVTPELPDVSGKLSEVRQLLANQRPQEAEPVLSNALREQGYKPKIAVPLPLGDLKFKMPGMQPFKHYSRMLDMETGVVTVQWQDGMTNYVRRTFVSRTENLVVCHIGASGPEPIRMKISLDMHDHRDARTRKNAKLSPLPTHREIRTDPSYLYYAARNDDGMDFGATARITTCGGTVSAESDGIRVAGAQSVLICLSMFVKGDRSQDWPRLQQELTNIAADYDALLKPHALEHGRMFSKTSLDLSATERERCNEELLLEAYQGEAPLALIEKMWAYGRYLLLSSSREGGHPCHLYGLWCGEYEGMWAFNMSNENLQMIYWQAFSGNMTELFMAVFDYFDRLIADFRLNALRLYGCRGIFVPAPTAPDSGLLKTLSPHIIHWTGGAGWIARFYYDYYLYTNDLHFLRERALPFLRETALFYEDFFVIGPDGYFVSSPSNSPENTPGNYWDGQGMGAVMETTINATMDFAIAKEVLTHLVEGSRLTGMYSDQVDQWESMVERIPGYQINEDGAIREWMHPFFEDNYHHRHQSHIYPVFPGTEITRSCNPELYEAFVIAVKKRLTVGLGEQTGWSLAHMSGNYARMGEGNLALECLDILARSCIMGNFYTLHNDWRQMGIGVNMDWAPFQIDANMGWTAAVQEMLLFSIPGEIHCLPALPERWRKGKVERLLAAGAIEVDIEWDQDLAIMLVRLISLHHDQQVDIIPQGVKDGETDEQIKNKTICLNLEQGREQSLRFHI